MTQSNPKYDAAKYDAAKYPQHGEEIERELAERRARHAELNNNNPTPGE